MTPEYLHDLDDDDLADLARQVKARQVEVAKDWVMVSHEVVSRLEEREATALPGDGFELRVVAKRRYHWDEQMLWQKLKPLLTSVQWHSLVMEYDQPKLKPSTVRLLAHAKRLGKHAAASQVIAAARRVEEYQQLEIEEDRS